MTICSGGEKVWTPNVAKFLQKMEISIRICGKTAPPCSLWGLIFQHNASIMGTSGAKGRKYPLRYHQSGER